MPKRLRIRECVINKTYLTMKGLRIQIIRKRPDSDDWVILSLASGGHELVLNGDVEVLEDTLSSPAEVVVPAEDAPSAAVRLRLLANRIVQESSMSAADLASIVPYSADVINEELKAIVQ